MGCAEVTGLEVATELERVAFRAFPATEEEPIGGFLCRSTPSSHSRRFNSATTLLDRSRSSVDIAPVIAWYEQREQDPLVRVLSGAPDQVDRALAASGWEQEAPTIVATRRLGSAVREPEVLPARACTEWLEVKAHSAEIGSRDVVDWLERVIASPARFGHAASRDRDGELVAIGIGVADGAWLGIFDMYVKPGHRRTGHGRRVLGTLLTWGRASGCSHAYLQVMTDNEAALGLYRAAGLRNSYQYWYRRPPEGGARCD